MEDDLCCDKKGRCALIFTTEGNDIHRKNINHPVEMVMNFTGQAENTEKHRIIKGIRKRENGRRNMENGRRKTECGRRNIEYGIDLPSSVFSIQSTVSSLPTTVYRLQYPDHGL